MVQSLEHGSNYQTNHAQNAPPEPTAKELLQQIIELRRENELIRHRVDEAHRRAEEVNADNLAARREVAKTRRQMEETI